MEDLPNLPGVNYLTWRKQALLFQGKNKGIFGVLDEVESWDRGRMLQTGDAITNWERRVCE